MLKRQLKKITSCGHLVGYFRQTDDNHITDAKQQEAISKYWSNYYLKVLSGEYRIIHKSSVIDLTDYNRAEYEFTLQAIERLEKLNRTVEENVVLTRLQYLLAEYLTS